jgi:hypothetical protein
MAARRGSIEPCPALLSTRIVGDHQAVFVEDLCVAGLGRTRLSKSVHDAAWSRFVRMLEYKAARHGRTFGKIGRFVPTTKSMTETSTRRSTSWRRDAPTSQTPVERR